MLDRLGRPDAGDDVLSLRVDEELAVEAPLAGRRVAREADPRPGRVPLVAEHHLDDVHGGAEVVRDVVRAAIDTRARRLPRVEHGAGGASQLLAGVRRERRADLALVELLEGRDQAAQVVGRQLDVESRAARFLERLQLALEDVPVDPVDDLAVHLDQTAVRVEREPWVAGRGREPLDGDVVQAEVEDRVHHPGHRDRGAGAHGDEERVGGVAESLPGLLLEPRDVVVDLGPELLRHLAAAHGGAAGVRRDREAGRDGDPERGHLGEPDPLAAEQLPASRGLLVVCIDQPHGAILRTPRDSAEEVEDLSRAARRDRRNGQRMREDDRRSGACGDPRRAVRRARCDPLAGGLERARRRRAATPRRAARGAGRLGGRRLVSRQARRPRPRARGHGRLARPAAPGLAPAPRRPDAAPRADPRGAVEREPRVALGCPRRLATRSFRYALANERPRRHRYPRELARFRVARLRSPAEVDAFLRSARRRERSSATQAAPRSPSQMGVRTT